MYGQVIQFLYVFTGIRCCHQFLFYPFWYVYILMGRVSEQPSIGLSATLTSSSVKCLFMSFAHFLIRLLGCFLFKPLSLKHSSCSLNTRDLSDKWFTHIFSYPLAFVIILLAESFKSKILKYLSIFPFMGGASSVKSKSSSPSSRPQRFPLIFFLRVYWL